VIQIIQYRTQSAENGSSLFKRPTGFGACKTGIHAIHGNIAVLNYPGRSLRASREAALQWCRLRVTACGAPFGKDAPLPARCALQSTTSRFAEYINIFTKEYC